ncbi:MAG: hypothetical protein II824_10460 [Bacteroidales bacterium]|nr:hypothetical protein [Bacteroidales bacterium]
MKKFHTLFLSLIVLSACGSRREVADIWSYIMERPDSALTVLNSLDASEYRGRTLADYRLLKAMALDKNYIDVASDSLARPALDYFRKHGPEEKEMLSMYYLGMSQYYSKDYNNAVVSLDYVSNLAEQCENPRYIALSQIYLSHIYHRRYNFTEAISAAQRSIHFFESLPDSSYQVRWARLHLADCFVGKRQFDDANDIYSSLAGLFPSDSALIRQVLPHFAWSMLLSGEENALEAFNIYQKAFKVYHAKLDCYNLHHYGMTLLSLGKEEAASAIIHELEDFTDYPELQHDLKFRLLKKRGDYKAALGEYELLDGRQNEVAREMMYSSLYKYQRDFQRLSLENTQLQFKVERERMLIIQAIILLFVIIIGWFAVFWWRRAKREKEQLVSSIEDMTISLAQYQEQNTHLEDELELVRQKYVGAYKKQFQKIASLVEYYRTTSGRKDGRDLVYRQVMELSSTVGKDRMSMRALERNINAALDNAMSLYREDFPKKSRDHYDLVCYFMAGFPASLIEILTGIPKNTLYSKKSRLLDELEASHSSHRDLFCRAIK